LAYRIDIYPDVQEQIQALPAQSLTSLAEALTVLSLTPWNGDPYNRDKPDGVMRQRVIWADPHSR
jgi:hypothetical protein